MTLPTVTDSYSKPQDAICKERKISREKLLAYLKSTKLDAGYTTNEYRYMYITGRNILADVMITGIMFGDFDETEEK